ALFFPVPVAIAATAVVHLANNGFKLALVGRRADWSVVRRFSLPAAVAAIAGASLLSLFASLPTLGAYRLGGREFQVTLVKVVIGALIVGFAWLEASRRMEQVALPARYLVLGGALSGFFGGLSGNQGAFRSAFLIKAGLDKQAFVGTSVVSTIVVDSVRLVVYGLSLVPRGVLGPSGEILGVIVVATASAFLGAYLGARLLQQVTLRVVRVAVAVMLFVVGAGLVAGLV
ncbi:MAG TPA: TSUP family transporter, partial [Methylomirabilota bacterium]|nr:TSUP family transporter [Methylomirabilota bacterium]